MLSRESVPLGFVIIDPNKVERLRALDLIESDFVVVYDRETHELAANGALERSGLMLSVNHQPVLDGITDFPLTSSTGETVEELSAASAAVGSKVFLAPFHRVRNTNFLLLIDQRLDRDVQPGFTRGSAYNKSLKTSFQENLFGRKLRKDVVDDDIIVVDNRPGKDFPREFDWNAGPIKDFFDVDRISILDLGRNSCGEECIFWKSAVWRVLKCIPYSQAKSQSVDAQALCSGVRKIHDISDGLSIYRAFPEKSYWAVRDIIEETGMLRLVNTAKGEERQVSIPRDPEVKKILLEKFCQWKERTTVTITAAMRQEAVTAVAPVQDLIRDFRVSQAIGDYEIDVAAILMKDRNMKRKREEEEAAEAADVAFKKNEADEKRERRYRQVLQRRPAVAPLQIQNNALTWPVVAFSLPANVAHTTGGDGNGYQEVRTEMVPRTMQGAINPSQLLGPGQFSSRMSVFSGQQIPLRSMSVSITGLMTDNTSFPSPQLRMGTPANPQADFVWRYPSAATVSPTNAQEELLLSYSSVAPLPPVIPQAYQWRSVALAFPQPDPIFADQGLIGLATPPNSSEMLPLRNSPAATEAVPEKLPDPETLAETDEHREPEVSTDADLVEDFEPDVNAFNEAGFQPDDNAFDEAGFQPYGNAFDEAGFQSYGNAFDEPDFDYGQYVEIND